MHCTQPIAHIIRKGDTLFQIARYYQTSVPTILSQNPNLHPYSLQIGTSINICPGNDFIVPTGKPNPTVCQTPAKKINVNNDMRLAWLQHVYWTRMLLISIAEQQKDQQAVTKRLLQNPTDIANIFSAYYSLDIANSIAHLLTEHLKIGAALITALRDRQKQEADKLNRQWYINADQMAKAFSSINPHYNREHLRKMLYHHIGLTTQEVAMRLAGNYPADILAFNRVEREILLMADYFTAGLVKQFEKTFN